MFRVENSCFHLHRPVANDNACVKSTSGRTGNGEAFETVAEITSATKARVAKRDGLRN